MCEKCEARKAEALAEMTPQFVKEVRALALALSGDFSECEGMENINGDESPETVCAYIACRAAILAAVIDGVTPFQSLGHWAALMLQSELESALEHQQNVENIARNQ